ncbi:MAG: hypothetical protein MJZ30_07415 [Paludibacteraceae bacterium]|nr:hypothetical protein [Paludibacteraceae bacterium]
MAMKAERLMINDLVRTNRGEVIKVESISTKRQHRKVGFHRADDKYHIKYVRQGQIEPILLTKEILIGFGFTDCDKAVFQRRADTLANKQISLYLYDGTLIVGFPGKDQDIILIHEVFTMHRLQQALRMCGLDDFANNIIIEENGSSKIYV